MYVYASGYGGIIQSFTFDMQSGKLTPGKALSGLGMPSFLAWNPAGTRLYAVNELVPKGTVLAFSVNAADGSLTKLNTASSGGAGPAALSVDASGQWIFTANYDGGQAGMLPATSAGVGASVDTESFGMDAEAHDAVFDPANKFAFVVLKGDDSIRQFQFNATTGKLKANTPDLVKTASGVGPRHIAFRPDSRFAYVVTEQGASIIAYKYDANKGTLSELQTEPMDNNGDGAEIAVHPSGNGSTARIAAPMTSCSSRWATRTASCPLSGTPAPEGTRRDTFRLSPVASTCSSPTKDRTTSWSSQSAATAS